MRFFLNPTKKFLILRSAQRARLEGRTTRLQRQTSAEFVQVESPLLLVMAGPCPGHPRGSPGHVWMAPGSQGFFGRFGSQVACGHVSGLCSRPVAAGPD